LAILPLPGPGLTANNAAYVAPRAAFGKVLRYFSVYTREQAQCHYSPALIANLEKHWDAANRRG